MNDVELPIKQVIVTITEQTYETNQIYKINNA